MERIVRPKIEDIPNLSSYITTFEDYNVECATGSREWQSSGTIYNLLKSEVKKISESHCSFCDGYPLNDTSKETIEHYYPKAEYKHKTYEWIISTFVVIGVNLFPIHTNHFKLP